MGHCLRQLLLIYHLLCYHDYTFIKQSSSKIGKNWHKPPLFLLKLFLGKIDMKYKISVSEFTPASNFSLIHRKLEKLVKKVDFDPKNKKRQGTSGDIINFIMVLGTICDITCTLPNFFPIDL